MYSRKKTFEELPQAMTAVWSCTRDDCNGWMRANFSFEDEPDCPKCHSAMVSEMRSLPVLINTSRLSGIPQPANAAAEETVAMLEEAAPVRDGTSSIAGGSASIREASSMLGGSASM